MSVNKFDLPTFDLPQNYSILINKLERLALGLDSAFTNLSAERKEIEIDINPSVVAVDNDDFQSTNLLEDILSDPIAAGRAPPPRASYAHNVDMEYSHFVSDIWIGVILTLLIVSVIFFICSCFLYHKFQQWKNSYRTNHGEPVEICRHYAPDFEAESLPSYTIVSGLPTYDDALEEFRKAGIILTPTMVPVVKLFEKDKDISKENQIYTVESGFNDINGGNIGVGVGVGVGGGVGGDNVSVASTTCTCGASNNTPYASMLNLNAAMPSTPMTSSTQVIELSPEQLAALSQKRLSLQIAFNGNQSIRGGGGGGGMVSGAGVRRNSRPRIDLYRAANRNNLFRSRAMTGIGNSGMIANNTANTTAFDGFPQLHRSTSSTSLALTNEPNMLDRHLQKQLQHHRGSLF